MKNVQINTDFSYNFVFSSYWFGQTLLYTTQDHILYLNLDGESQIIFTFNSSRSVICNTLADRISIATYDNADDVIIKTRKVHMLEPLLMGYLASIKDSDEIDIKVIKCIKYLDTEQLSKKLISKLISKKMYFSAWYLLQNPLSPQFTLNDKFRCLQELHKPKELFELIFGPNKDVLSNRADLAESIQKLSPFEKDLLRSLHEEFSSGANYTYALK